MKPSRHRSNAPEQWDACPIGLLDSVARTGMLSRRMWTRAAMGGAGAAILGFGFRWIALRSGGEESEHRRTRALLARYLQGRLAAEERQLVEIHLAACSTCRAALQEMRRRMEASERRRT